MYRDPRFQRFEVIPLTGALGAEIRGVDLATDPDDTTFTDLRRALDHFHVLAVRDQRFTPEILHRVGRRFGPFSGNPVHAGMEGLDDVVLFAREKDATGMVIGENWHMDLAWMERPPGITLLYGHEVPPVGGDTCFTSLEQAYRALSPGMQALLGGLTGIFSGRGVFTENASHKGLAIRTGSVAVENLEREHPIVCRHPATGIPYVFVASTLNRFKGMTEAESRPIISYLMHHATRPEFNCRLRWEQGTLGMWANPFVMHTAINDYPGYRREMYRTTVEGEIPAAAGTAAAGSAVGRGGLMRARVAVPLLAPAHALLAGVIVLPAIYVAWLEFTASSFGRAPVFVGLGNYIHVLTDPYFWRALRNTVAVVLVVVHVELVVGLGMALLFAGGLPARRFLIAAVLAPYAVSEVSAVLMWRFLFDPDAGPITMALHAIGLPGLEWSVSPVAGLAIVTMLSVWLNLPFTFVILYAARLSVPGELYEAAGIDGARRLQMFRHITLPMLRPAMLVAMLFRYIFAFRLFAEVWLLTQGAPARSTEVVGVYLYLEAFRFNAFGLAAATGWIMVAVSLLLGAFYLWRLRRGMIADAVA